jgi:hypothetical protein
MKKALLYPGMALPIFKKDERLVSREMVESSRSWSWKMRAR